MIWTVLQVNLRRLLHNRMELLLTFVVPIAFFSIFAVIFGGGVGGMSTPKIKVVAVDEINSTSSGAVIESLKTNAGLRFMRDEEPASLRRQDARELVRRGSVTMAIVLHNVDDQVTVDLLTDSSDQVASQVVSALVTRSLMMAGSSRRRPARESLDQTAAPVDRLSGFAGWAGRKMSAEPSRLTTTTPKPDVAEPDFAEPDVAEPDVAEPDVAEPNVAERIKVVDVIGEGKSNPVVSMYAAGIAVMFLLFGATGGGGALLEERENQTLDRLLSTQLSMDHLLLGKWFYMTALGDCKFR